MKSKTTAALLALFFGGVGIHKFYLKKTKQGFLYLLFSWTGIPFILGIFDFLYLILMNTQEFNLKYNLLQQSSLSTEQHKEHIVNFNQRKYPDRSQNIEFLKQKLKELKSKGDFDSLNITYAKLIEALRQQNENLRGELNETLNYYLNEYQIFLEKNNYKLPRGYKVPDKILIIQKDKKIINEVKEMIRKWKTECNPLNPLFKKDYSIESGIPCKDLSKIIKEWLIEKKYQHLLSLLSIFYNVNEIYLKPKLEKFLSKQYDIIFSDDKNLFIDIQVFMLLNGILEEPNTKFWISNDGESLLLAKILVPYNIRLNKNKITKIITELNKFLKEMKNDNLTDYWLDYPNYKNSDFSPKYEPPITPEFSKILKELSPAERLHFFDLVNSKNPYLLDGKSYYNTRKFGIDEKSSLQHMLNLGLIITSEDLKSVGIFYTKEELLKRSLEKNFDVKKSWTKTKLIDYLLSLDSGKQFIKELLKDKTLYKINEKFVDDIFNLNSYVNQLKLLADLIVNY